MLTRLEVNVATVKKNILFIKKEIKDKLKFEHITATLKGNAYGFGIEKIANLCLANGVDTIAVARMSEAIQLRQLVKGKYEIMLIGIVDNEDVALAIKHNAILPVTSIEHANEMAKLNIKNLKIQFKLNTGMNRIGFKNKEDLKAAYTLLTKKGVKVMGVYSHIYDNGDVEKSKKQFDLFEELASAIPN
jgi:alanine racemase